ncbi:MAG: hypothetical protein IPJ65_30695 [Archangiaceae bacterium]|nr:hypothetical protein [Archangiaceae bacterium]
MENGIKKQNYDTEAKQIPDAVITAAKQFGTKAATLAGEQATRLAETTEKNVRKYPLAAIGIAAGCGAVLGTLGTLLFMPRQKTMLDRAKDLEFYGQARRLWSKYF